MIDQEPTDEEKALVGKLIRFKTEKGSYINIPVIRTSIQEELEAGSSFPRTWFGGRHAKPVGKTKAEAIKTFYKQNCLLIVDLVMFPECETLYLETLYLVVDNESGSLYLINRDSFDLL